MSSSSVSGVGIEGTVKVASGALAAGKTNGLVELEEGAALGANSIFPTGDEAGLTSGVEAGTSSEGGGWPP